MTTTELQTDRGGTCTPDGGCAIGDRHGARMNHPAMIVPPAMAALQALGAAIAETGVPVRTLDLINVRVSQINSCGVCLLGHIHVAKTHGVSEDELAVVAGWREAPFFSDAERAALALAEAMTRFSDRPDAVPD